MFIFIPTLPPIIWKFLVLFSWQYSYLYKFNKNLSSVQSLSHVWLFAIPRFAACQASLSFCNSFSLIKLMSIQLVMPSSYLFLCYPLLLLPSIFPSIKVFSKESSGGHQASGGQSIGASASASVFPMNIQDWFPSGCTGLISLKSKGLSRVFSNTTVLDIFSMFLVSVIVLFVSVCLFFISSRYLLVDLEFSFCFQGFW